MTIDLKARQEAGAAVEKKMLEFLVEFEPAGNLKLSDAKCIARFARTYAFEAFSPPTD